MSETSEYYLHVHTCAYDTYTPLNSLCPGKWGDTWRYGRGYRGVAPNIGSTNAGAYTSARIHAS